MSAVLGRNTARTLALLDSALMPRTFAWHDGRAVGTDEFLADIAAVAAALPPGRDAINLCEDRYAFIVAFCAVVCRGQTNLLPPSRARQAVDEAFAAYPGCYALSEVALTPTPGRFVRLPALGSRSPTPGPALPTIAATHVAAIGFTSGSTGQPKPNPKTWAAFNASNAHNVRALAAELKLAPGTIGHVVATVPPQHMYGIELSVLLPLLGPFAVHSARPLFPADVAAALAEVPEPRLLVTTPVHLRALLRDPLPLPRLVGITSATAPLPQVLAREAEARYGAPVLELFGSTETCVIARRRCAREETWHLYADVSVTPQPDGTSVDAPYFSQPVVLQDVIEILPDRCFHLRGRNADLVEIAGKRASLADLGRRVLALRGVHDAAVWQMDEADCTGVQRIAALVVAPGRSEADLLEELRGAIDPAFLPRPLRVIAALPRNETGKLPRAALLGALRSTEILSPE